MDVKQIQQAVSDGIAAGVAPLKAELDAANKRIAELSGARETDLASSLVGLVGKPKDRNSAEDARMRMRLAGADEMASGAVSKEHIGLRLGRFIRGAMLHRSMEQSGTRATLAEVFKDLLGDKRMADIVDAHTRTMQAGQFASGGSFLPDYFAAEWIEFLRPANVVLQMGPRVLPLEGNLTIAKVTAGSDAAYEGENVAPTPVEQDTGAVRLSAKKAIVLEPVSNTLLRRGGPTVDQMIADDLRRAMAGLMDQTAMRGTGLSSAPAGIKGLLDADNVVTAYNAIAPTGAQAEASLSDIMGKVEDADNLVGSRFGWLLAPRVKRYLAMLRSATGVPYFEEMKNGTLLGYPFAVTTHIPKNLGNASNESEIYFGAFEELLIGIEEQLQLEIFPNGTYTNSGGTVISGISTDVTVVRAISSHDFQLRHTKAFAKGDAVKWGAAA